MKYQAALVLLVIALARAAYVCPKFHCGVTYELELDEVCSRKTTGTSNTTFQLLLCASPNYQNCSFDFAASSSSCVNASMAPGSLLPGEPCQYGDYCISGSCMSGYCVGKELGLICKVNADCRVGTFCNYYGKCEALAAEGAVCGGVMKTVCQNHLVCVNNNCTRIGSLEIGVISNDPLACKSMYIATDELGVQRCSLGLSNVGYSGNLVECQMGSVCNYTINGSDTVTYTSPCKCGVNPEGKSYCHPGEGKMQSDIDIVWERAHNNPV